MARRCGVCGLETEEAACPRCNTILVRGQAICPTCGKIFEGWIALCDVCGASLGPEPTRPADADAVRALAAVPGIGEDRARVLVAKGYRDFADIVRLALPESEVRKGLHHAIARRALLADLAPQARREESKATCPVCGSPWQADADRCPVCGSGVTTDLPISAVEAKLAAVTDELIGLARDADVRSMPEDVRKELLDAFAGLTPEEVLRDEYRHQVDAWRDKGFDVAPLEALLDADLDGFRDRGVRLIRAQILKRVRGGDFRCPLCDVVLSPEAEACENCGAKFV